MKKIFILTFLLSLVLVRGATAQRIVSYGFEDPTSGNTYPITGSSQVTRSDVHIAATQVISSYSADEMNQTWMPHSGSYFLLQNDSSDYVLDPAVPGITSGTVQAFNHFWRGDPYCSTDQGNTCSDLRLGEAMNTGEIFIRFWARMNDGWYKFADPGSCKLIRILPQGGYDSIEGSHVFIMLSTADGITPKMYIATEHIPGMGGYHDAPNAYDGNWHKYSAYVNYNTGTVMAWYDTEIETAENALTSWTAPDGAILDPGDVTESQYFIIQGNFSAKDPSQEIYHAIDDVEVWDGLPENSDPIPPSAPSGLSVR